MARRVGPKVWPVVCPDKRKVKARHDEGQHRDGLWLVPLRFPNRPYKK